MRPFVGFAWRALRRIGHEIAETIRFGAEPIAIARTVGGTRQGESISPAIGGALAVGAGQRFGEEATEGSVSEPERD